MAELVVNSAVIPMMNTKYIHDPKDDLYNLYYKEQNICDSITKNLNFTFVQIS